MPIKPMLSEKRLFGSPPVLIFESILEENVPYLTVDLSKSINPCNSSGKHFALHFLCVYRILNANLSSTQARNKPKLNRYLLIHRIKLLV